MSSLFKKISIISLLLSFITAHAFASKSLVSKKEVEIKSTKQSFKIDTSKSTLNWKATKLKGEHVGTMTFNTGKLVFSGSELLNAEFEIDMNSIVVTDVKDPKWNLKLITHLKNKDFFDTESHSKAKFKTSSIMMAKGGDLDVIGILTIKGISKQASFRVHLEKSGSRFVTATGVLIFDRTHYGITYKSANFFKKLGDKLIHDKVELKFNVLAKVAN